MFDSLHSSFMYQQNNKYNIQNDKIILKYIYTFKANFWNYWA